MLKLAELLLLAKLFLLAKLLLLAELFLLVKLWTTNDELSKVPKLLLQETKKAYHIPHYRQPSHAIDCGLLSCFSISILSSGYINLHQGVIATNRNVWLCNSSPNIISSKINWRKQFYLVSTPFLWAKLLVPTPESKIINASNHLKANRFH